MRTRQIIAIIALALFLTLCWVMRVPEYRVIVTVCLAAELVIYCLPGDDGRR